MTNEQNSPARPEAEVLSEIADRLRNATPGPWEWWAPDESLTEQGVMTHTHPDIRRDESGNIVHGVTICRGMTGPARAENAQLIAHAPTDLAYLLSQHARLTERLGEVEAELQRDREYFDRVRKNVIAALSGTEPERAAAQMAPDDYDLVMAVVQEIKLAALASPEGR